MHSAVLTVAALAGLATAKRCQNATVPVNVQVRQGVFGNVAVPQTNLEATTFIQNNTQQGRNFTALALTDYADVSGTYNISAQFCQPDQESSSPAQLQILTHGIGFDKTYWDLSYNDYNYSYIDAAIDAGFSTLSYDRLGIGNSSHGEPRDEIQTSLEVEALHQLTMMIQGGKYPGVNTTFSKTVHVGHSFGSVQTSLLVNMYPSISDAIILTGYTTNASFLGVWSAGGNFKQASLNAPVRFGDTNAQKVQQLVNESPLADYLSGIDLSTLAPGQNLPKGYIISNDAAAIQFQFFYPGYFDPAVLQLADDTKQPVTIGELLTIGSQPTANKFAGPVLVINGDGDVPFCGGDCMATGDPAVPSITDAVAKAFPNVDASNFTAYNQLNTGHGINLHFNATGAYAVIQDFLSSKNIGSGSSSNGSYPTTV